MARSIKAHILLVLVTFAWGATFVSVKDALGNVSPLVFNALRMAIASVALIVIFHRELRQLIPQRLKPRGGEAEEARLKSCRDTGSGGSFTTAEAVGCGKGAEVGAAEAVGYGKGEEVGAAEAVGCRGMMLGGALLGVWLWIGYSCQTIGLAMTTPSKSAFITGLAVVLVPLIVAVSGRRVPNRWTLVGVVCAFVGLYLMTIPKIPTLANDGRGWGTRSSLMPFISGINLGDLITLGCAVAYAAHIYTMGRLMQRYPFKPIAVMQVVTAAVLMGVTVPLGPVRLVLTGEAVFAILFTALICTAAAFSIQAWAQQFTPPTHTALIFALEPVFAALASRVLLGEHLGARGTVGALLILSGILVSELKGSSAEVPKAVNAEFSIN